MLQSKVRQCILKVDTTRNPMRATIQKWGNSLALRIPKAFACDVGLSKNAEVELQIVDGEIHISPVPPERLSLEALVSEITADNRHGEAFPEESAGSEAW